MTIVIYNQIEYDHTIQENSAGPSNVPPPTGNSTRSGRTVRFPRRFDDYLPAVRTALAHIPSKENQNPPQASEDPISHPESFGNHGLATGVQTGSASHTPNDGSLREDLAPITTDIDNFGVYRVYARTPICDPLQCSDARPQAPGDFSSDSRQETACNRGPINPNMQATAPYYHPFSNPSAATMMAAHYSGTPLQSAQKTTLFAHILGSLGSDLDPSDLCNFNITRENKRLDSYLTSASETAFQSEDGWLESSVKIRLPLDKKKMLETEAAEFEIGGVFHRDIIDVISSVYQSDAVKSFHFIPFKEFWKPSEDAPPERLYGELFSSQAMLDADDEICRQCLENDPDHPDLEAVSVPILLYSDSTHLASFGTASCWPVYMFFGSQSKYVRAMPTSYACHHIAYIPKVRIFRGFFSLFTNVVTTRSYQIPFRISIRNNTTRTQRPILSRTAKGS